MMGVSTVLKATWRCHSDTGGSRLQEQEGDPKLVDGLELCVPPALEII